jgi:hypothetical protein
MFTNLPLNQEKTYHILQQLALSDDARELIKLSFRTRVKESAEETISVQFRILPEKISSAQQERIDQVRDEITTKLKKHYPEEQCEVVIQVTMCCGSECFWCRKFLW